MVVRAGRCGAGTGPAEVGSGGRQYHRWLKRGQEASSLMASV